MSPRKLRRSESLVLDPDVLRPGPVCEFQSSQAVEAQGGIAIQPWRDVFLADQAAGISVLSHAREVASASFTQAIVHLQKSRAATFDDLGEAWRILAPDGELFFFRRITFPLLMPTTLFVLVNAIINAFRLVDHVVVMTRGGPDNATSLLLYYVYEIGFRFWDTAYAAALTVVLLAVLALAALAQFFFLERKVHYQ
jgi:hypothetical protein